MSRHLLTLPLVFFVACQGPDGSRGDNSLVGMIAEPAGENCVEGGQKITVGLDTNKNGTLEESEVTQTSYICGGGTGESTLVSLTEEAAGENCAFGGNKVQTGVDDDGDKALEESEVDATQYICSGKDGNTLLSTAGSVAPGANLSLDISGSDADLTYTAQTVVGGQLFDHADYGEVTNAVVSEVGFGPAVDTTFIRDSDALITTLADGNKLMVEEFYNVADSSIRKTMASVISPSGTEVGSPVQLAAFDNLDWEDSNCALVGLSGGGFMFLIDDADETFGIYDSSRTQTATGTLALANLSDSSERLLLPDGEGSVLFFGDSNALNQLTFAKYSAAGNQTMAPTALLDGYRLDNGLVGEVRPDGRINLVFGSLPTSDTDNGFRQSNAAIINADGSLVGIQTLSQSYLTNRTTAVATASNGNWMVVFEHGGPDASAYAILDANAQFVQTSTSFIANEPTRMTGAVLPDGSFAVLMTEDDSLVPILQIVHNDGTRPTGPKPISVSVMPDYSQPMLFASGNNALHAVYGAYDNNAQAQFVTMTRGYLDLQINGTTSATLTNYTNDTVSVVLSAQ